MFQTQRDTPQRHPRGINKCRVRCLGGSTFRSAGCTPSGDDIKTYLGEQPKVLPKSPEGQAISYTLLNWRMLMCCSEGGDLEIDNHGTERSLRRVVVGRKKTGYFLEATTADGLRLS